MHPEQFLSPTNPLGYPAPYWFLAIFKVLGFILHLVPMSLWFSGLLLALIMYASKHEMGKLMASRLGKQLPVIVALGINFGIVPLLFLQVAYYRAFYPATIIMAWFWLSIIPLLTVAYYCVYLFASGFKAEIPRYARIYYLAGWIASFCFLAISFIFVNAMRLMANPGIWERLWGNASVEGAVLGLGQQAIDPAIFSRWLMVFGLALTTTAVYLAIDCAFSRTMNNDNYRKWLHSFIFKVYSVGAAWFALTGTWYILGTWSPDVQQQMFGGGFGILTVLTGISIGIPWLALFLSLKKMITKSFAVFLGFMQFTVILLNAISRQIVQNLELSKYIDVTAEKVTMQWSPLVLFLLLFASGLGIVYWMISRTIKECYS